MNLNSNLRSSKEGTADKLLSSAVEHAAITVTGVFTDVLLDTSTGKKTCFTTKKNLIVSNFSVLAAALMKNEVGYIGLQYWAAGDGEGVSWDALTQAQRDAKSTISMVTLYNELARVPVTMTYIDGAGNPIGTPTHIIDISATFGTNISADFREFGLFGGNATITLGSGLMIDHKAHAKISLNTGGATGLQLQRTLRLTL